MDIFLVILGLSLVVIAISLTLRAKFRTPDPWGGRAGMSQSWKYDQPQSVDDEFLDPTVVLKDSNDELCEASGDDPDEGPQVDVIQNASGRFGYDASNPIPVQGQSGQLEYLAHLRCSCGSYLHFHRAGSCGAGPDGHVVDRYDVSCIERQHVTTLYFDMYHGGPSNLLPVGYSMNEMKGVGFPFFVDNFPESMEDFVREHEQRHGSHSELEGPNEKSFTH